MFPIVLDLDHVSVALVGAGQLATKRLKQLDQAGARRLTVFSEAPDEALAASAGERLIRRLPTDGDLAAFQVIYIVDLDPGVAADLAARCRALGRLVNVEDVKPLCDFHTPSQVRRGDLLLSISTGGKSPGLAQRLRRYLEDLFQPDWEDHLDELARARAHWRAEGADMRTVARRTEDLIEERGWLR
ncbi:bifunctional precorrin-2 dehydrogenase/sirohydrochlorin ferrochelatase [Skermanella rosea]|uniref:precorrin-2 dehydrogenase/sirohydrochlorin ferrochelatase family protein n=1 Tax=Skermanella rosea TaxID=1817965 RepID=UPI001933EA19|nr:bifunctional precorrin-2 dehydrogenase/sirohydrochlorin ferrochelatase [Skermanella rosea]UEM03215.1 bifunctional precorrin-2 dehydrogenase/sirohydrochlorin ferrochelatase [Skermanella rosea]